MIAARPLTAWPVVLGNTLQEGSFLSLGALIVRRVPPTVIWTLAHHVRRVALAPLLLLATLESALAALQADFCP